MAFAYLFEYYLMLAFSIVALFIAGWAFLDCLRHPGATFQREGKRTKGFWLGMTGGSAAVCLLSFMISGGFLQIIAVCIAAVYHADVKPAVSGKGGNYYRY
jgi:hypothetical protein